ncbi:MAG: AAA family ATPase [Planctomycetes bacterium]|nr:AAA family ATPase [Planctomycetota bacterium]
MMRPLYVSATKQDTGKTTHVIGLFQAFRDLGYNVGYMKPVGQRYVRYEGQNIDEDAVLARITFNLTDPPADMSSIAIERGFTANYIFHRDPKPLENRIMGAFNRLRRAHDLMVVEGTGHAGVGSCFDLSNARVAQIFGGAVIIITEGGIGRAIDEIALSLHLFREHGVTVLGAILNKTLPEKLDKVRTAVAQGLENLGTRLLGVVPYRPQLLYPRMEQIATEVRGQVLCCDEALPNVIENIVVAAMAPQHVAPYLRERTLAIAPGDRIDGALVSVLTGATAGDAAPPVCGLVLTGGFEPDPQVLDALKASGVPVVLCKEDTYSVAARLKTMRFKIRVEDTDKIADAKRLVRESIDVEALAEQLKAL